MGVDKDARKDWESFVVNSDSVRISGYYDKVNNRIYIREGWQQLEDGARYRILSRCGIEVKVKVDKYKKRMKVLGQYIEGRFKKGATVDEVNNKRTLDLVCMECDNSYIE